MCLMRVLRYFYILTLCVSLICNSKLCVIYIFSNKVTLELNFGAETGGLCINVWPLCGLMYHIYDGG